MTSLFQRATVQTVDRSTSPGPSRLANAGENRNDSYNLFNAVTLFPGAAPVVAGQQSAESRSTPDQLRFILVKPLLSPRPDRAQVYRNSTCTHRCYTGIRPRQSYGNTPV
ncbi:hypothetical protein DPMN_079008 [Dreissena polymorpha]|uniref:Uncharacterized protein n=1 Tax=Dreissena polymorpha TaxID=45954 RepID=A0A9D3YPY2_DREPO|nr:hypothetical protein DPMN_079008 [Dreissena polymorpha]